MEFGQFITIATEDKPTFEHYERATVFVNAASKEMLWSALTHGGIHSIYQQLINQALHRLMLRELERSDQSLDDALQQAAKAQAKKLR